MKRLHSSGCIRIPNGREPSLVGPLTSKRILRVLMQWINRSELEIKASFRTTHLSHPVRNKDRQSSCPSTIKSYEALAVNKSSGKITLPGRHNWSTLCTTHSASKLNQTKTSRNVSVLNMCRHSPSLLCSKQYAVITVSQYQPLQLTRNICAYTTCKYHVYLDIPKGRLSCVNKHMK